MFILRNRQQSIRAIENAKTLHPKVRMVELGEYEVSGSTGNTYTVLCYRASGERIVDCNCPSRVPSDTLPPLSRFMSQRGKAIKQKRLPKRCYIREALNINLRSDYQE